jgi:hypothetical protein
LRCRRYAITVATTHSVVLPFVQRLLPLDSMAAPSADGQRTVLRSQFRLDELSAAGAAQAIEGRLATDMSVVIAAHRNSGDVAGRALRASAAIWFVTALGGQWLFVYYIAAFYGSSTLSGDFESWRRNKGLIDGYVAGDAIGNLFFAAHVLIAAILTYGGTLQLIPQVRAHAVAFHRWNGRVFLLAAVVAASAGLYLEWVRRTGSHGRGTGVIEALGVTLDALLILLFAGLAWRAVIAGHLAAHRHWATRLFLVVNGVWFMRVGIAAWTLLTPLGAQPFFRFWSFGAYLVPLAVYEVYLRTQRAAAPARILVAAGVIALTLVTGIGSITAFFRMWRPLLGL